MDKKSKYSHPKANPKNRYVALRLTESEYEQIKADMDSMDYLSFSKYARSLLLHREIPVRKYVYTDKGLRTQINQISKKISKIGANYNQVVKKYNVSCTATKKNGDLLINTKSTIYYMTKLRDLTEELKALQNQLIETVSKIKLEQEETIKR